MQLALGTVQFGLDYGISNAAGRTPAHEVNAILDRAKHAGIEILDTAAAYGDAETVLSDARAQAQGFRIISKTARLAAGLEAVVARARESVANLGRPLDALLIHAASDLALPHGPALWKALEELRATGDVQRVGLSVYAHDPILQLVDRFHPSIIQLPTSILDQRLMQNGTLSALAERGIEIHVRSAFHQGLIFADPSRLPPKLQSRRETVAQLQKRLLATGLNPLEAALAYLKGLPEIGAIVVGVTRVSELDGIIAAWQAHHDVGDASAFALDDSLLLDPSAW